MKRLTIGIIGFGRFGKILTRHLIWHLPQVQVLVSSRRKNLKLPAAVKAVDLRRAVQAEVVIPCVPISKFEAVIKTIALLLKSGSLVIDVCTVKTHTVKVMRRWLPKNVNILATHPIWGPDSAAVSLKGLTTVLCPVRLPHSQLLVIKLGLEKIGQKVVILSPPVHDRFLARSQAVSHLYGRINQKLKLKATPIDTQGFKQLLAVQPIVVNDSWQLFADMFRFNPFARTMLKQVKQALNQIERQIKI